MRFAIDNGKPYLIQEGRAIPVSIKDNDVTTDKGNAVPTELKGRYTLKEVKAKCGNEVSSIVAKKRKKKAEE